MTYAGSNAILRIVTKRDARSKGKPGRGQAPHRWIFCAIEVTKRDKIERAEDALISLRSAGYIREAETFGYPVGDGGGAPDCGESPMLPRWLWSGEPEETEDGGNGKTFCEL